MGYGSTYENYIVIEIEKGKSNRSKDLNFQEYESLKEKQFDVYKKTDEYIKQKKRLKKKRMATKRH